MMTKEFPDPIALIVFDFDGVFTDNKVYIDEHGAEMVCCSRSDGLGISMLRAKGVPMLILSTEANPVVAARARKLRLPVAQDCSDKRKYLEKYLTDHGIHPENVIYVGNDINDLDAMRMIGFGVCTADSDKRVKKEASLVLSNNGGQGAVRELCEMVLMALATCS